MPYPLQRLGDPRDIGSVVAFLLSTDAGWITGQRGRQRRLNTELDRTLTAIRAGMDRQLAAAETRKIQAELAAANDTVRK